MTRARVNHWVDVAALASTVLVFPTGLILLARFHIGPEGQLRLSAMGLSRAVWLHLHQAAAVAMAAAVLCHVQLHWRIVVARIQRANWPARSDLALYAGFAIVMPAAVAAWLLLPDSLHHPAIDIHNVFNLVLLPGVVVHVRRHLRWLLRGDRLCK